MSSPAEQQPTASSRWWVRPCQWLFRGLLFLWITVLLGLALNVGATWLTTKGFEPQGTPLEWIIGQLPVALAGSGALLSLTRFLAHGCTWPDFPSCSDLDCSGI